MFGFDLIEGIADRRVTGNVEFDCRKYIFCIGRFGERRDRLFHLLEGAATDNDVVFLWRLGEQTSGPVTDPSVGTCDKCVVREGKFYCMKRGVLFVPVIRTICFSGAMSEFLVVLSSCHFCVVL